MQSKFMGQKSFYPTHVQQIHPSDVHACFLSKIFSGIQFIAPEGSDICLEAEKKECIHSLFQPFFCLH